jgi:hypothetical protein
MPNPFTIRAIARLEAAISDSVHARKNDIDRVICLRSAIYAAISILETETPTPEPGYRLSFTGSGEPILQMQHGSMWVNVPPAPGPF